MQSCTYKNKVKSYPTIIRALDSCNSGSVSQVSVIYTHNYLCPINKVTSQWMSDISDSAAEKPVNKHVTVLVLASWLKDYPGSAQDRHNFLMTGSYKPPQVVKMVCHPAEPMDRLTFLFLSPPNSKCLHLLMASILLDLQLGSTHSSLSTIFFVVLACYCSDHLATNNTPIYNVLYLTGIIYVSPMHTWKMSTQLLNISEQLTHSFKLQHLLFSWR